LDKNRPFAIFNGTQSIGFSKIKVNPEFKDQPKEKEILN
tara:strand:- start:220 stop:336 length:117 start_codon:yes stop_codon:yes gene_type:complete